MNRTIPAIIHATLAAGSTVTAPYYDINITQQLCTGTCTDNTPVFDPRFTIISVEKVGTGQFLVNIHVEGAVSYIPCGFGPCCTKTQVISQDFAVPVFSSASEIDATITAGQSHNYAAKVACGNCSRTFVSDTPVTLTIVTA